MSFDEGAPYDELFTAGPGADFSRVTGSGAGAARAVGRRVIELGGGEVRFGVSVGTADQHDAGTDRGWRVRPAVCLTLWETGAGPVLTVERLDRRPDRVAPLVSGPAIDRDVALALTGLLQGTGLTAHDDLWTLFDVRPSRSPWASFGIGRRKVAPPALVDLVARSVRHVRGVPVTEALLVVIAPDAGGAVDVLESGEDEDAVEVSQDSGWPHTWSRFAMAGEPVRPGASSLVRDDARAVLVDLESTSVFHDYEGARMAAMVGLTVPLVADRARVHRAFGAVHATVVDASSEVSEKLATVATVRELLLRRELGALMASPEQFETWSNPALLTKRLDGDIADADRELVDALPRLVDAAGAELEKRLESRREMWDDRFTVLGGVAAVATLVGLFAAFASLPGPASGSLLDSMPDAVVATVVGIAAGLLLGFGVVAGRRRSR
ncbi:hypothetical protein J1G42_05495 [Cellulomonas sp. zg-ZUI222]|uniref:Uncharacterized protein n=1 Tax=Cellulomonas wangleii TaxID=2816956 RepID=A0ABX8D3M0_9CELL|nr:MULTISPECIES: hypothetical protein [Cellulomonas]MBO0899425.1 hypothetical protein [Cellulomonas sp. zg-ZUI22]MBO0920276.1 hypothetical protein [Cellulomonas wangleii]MBO0923292.1 hypothetical protein [Cellulomonas wangleii]QVI61651.1 hypothetical protein KG103_14475 [Cellulomonas wangleii]